MVPWPQESLQNAQVLEESNSETEEEMQAQDPKLLISMHALHGRTHGKSTFTVNILIGNIPAVALVDAGSTTTFMSPKIAQQSQCVLQPSKKLKVTVANGENLWT